MTDDRHISQEDLALYAMQALAPEEGTPIETHLASCENCSEELSVLLGDMALVGLSADQRAVPEGAWARLQERLRSSVSTPGAATVRGEAPLPFPVEAPGPRRAWPVLLPWAIAAVLGITCIFLGIENRNLNETVDDESALVSNLARKASHAQQVLDVLSAPEAKRVTLTAAKTPPQPTGHAIYLADRGSLFFQANNLKPIPAGKTYELWVIPANGKPPLPAGTFRPDHQGYASVVLPQLPSGIEAKQFGVTVENQGGSTTPTLPIVLAGE